MQGKETRIGLKSERRSQIAAPVCVFLNTFGFQKWRVGRICLFVDLAVTTNQRQGLRRQIPSRRAGGRAGGGEFQQREEGGGGVEGEIRYSPLFVFLKFKKKKKPMAMRKMATI